MDYKYTIRMIFKQFLYLLQVKFVNKTPSPKKHDSQIVSDETSGDE